MSGIAVQVKTDAAAARSEFKGVGDEARRAKEEAKGLGDELKKAVGGPAVKDAAGRFFAVGKSVDSLRTSVQNAASASDAFNARMRSAMIDAERARNTLSPLEKNFKAISDELEHQNSIITRIRAPMAEYQRDVKNLNLLYKQGRIDAREYATEMERVGSKAGQSKGPSIGQDLLSSQGGGLGQLASGAMSAGMGNMLSGGLNMAIDTAKRAVEAIIDLGNAYTELSNAAEKVMRDGETTASVLDSQYDASVRLHSGLRETIGLLDAIRDGTNELNYTTREQQDLANAVGATVRLEGKSLGEAGHLMDTLSFAMANGAISGRELKGIMKEYPDLAAQMVEQFGKTRGELMKMANEGKFTGEMLATSFTKSGDALQEKLGDRLETTGEKWQHFKDKVTVAWGRIAQVTSSVVGSVIDQLTNMIDPTEDYRKSLEAAQHAMVFQDEIEKKMVENREKLIKTSQTLAAMQQAGVDSGPLQFDVSSVEKYERLRSTMAELGVTMDAVWTDASAKQLLYEREGEKITEQREAEKQADQVLKVWRALNNVNDILVEQEKKYQAATDKVGEYADAIKKLREQQSLSGPSPVFGTAPAPMFQQSVDGNSQGRDLMRGQTQATLDAAVATGKLSQESADAIKKQNELRDSVSNLKRDLASGAIDAKTYAEAIKGLGIEAGFTAELLKKLNQPFVDQEKTIKALNFLYKTGKIDVEMYNQEMVKALELQREQGPKVRFEDRKIGKQSMQVMFDDRDRFKAPEEKPSVIGDLSKLPSQDMGLKMNETLDRQREIMEKINGPIRIYRQSLADIDDLLKQNAITQAEATELTHEAAEAYKTARLDTSKATEATRRWNAELEQLRHNNHDLVNGVKNAMNEIKQEMDTTAATSQIVVDAFHGVRDSIVDAVTAGKDGFNSLEASGKALVKNLLAEFTKLMIMKAMVSAFGGPGGMPPLPGFAAGGMIQPGGSGGTDSQLVAFRKSPDETVRITTPGQERQLKNGTGRSGAAPTIVRIVNVDDPNRAFAAMDSRRGQRQIVNTLQQQRRQVRGTVSRS